MSQYRNNRICIYLIAVLITIFNAYREKTIHSFRAKGTIKLTTIIFIDLDEAIHVNNMKTSIDKSFNFVLVHVN